MNTQAEVEMPKYQSHKQVWALKVKEIQPLDEGEDGAMIVPEEDGYAPFRVDGQYMAKHKPQAGGYYVVYKDGYKSWSPAEAFEDGYTRVLPKSRLGNGAV